VEDDRPVVALVEAVLGRRRAGDVAAEALEARPVAGGDGDVGVEVEAVETGAAGRGRIFAAAILPVWLLVLRGDVVPTTYLDPVSCTPTRWSSASPWRSSRASP